MLRVEVEQVIVLKVLSPSEMEQEQEQEEEAAPLPPNTYTTAFHILLDDGIYLGRKSPAAAARFLMAQVRACVRVSEGLHVCAFGRLGSWAVESWACVGCRGCVSCAGVSCAGVSCIMSWLAVSCRVSCLGWFIVYHVLVACAAHVSHHSLPTGALAPKSQS